MFHIMKCNPYYDTFLIRGGEPNSFFLIENNFWHPNQVEPEPKGLSPTGILRKPGRFRFCSQSPPLKSSALVTLRATGLSGPSLCRSRSPASLRPRPSRPLRHHPRRIPPPDVEWRFCNLLDSRGV